MLLMKILDVLNAINGHPGATSVSLNPADYDALSADIEPLLAMINNSGIAVPVIGGTVNWWTDITVPVGGIKVL